MEPVLKLVEFLFILLLFAGFALFLLRKFKRRQFTKISEKGMIKIQDAVQLGFNDKVYVVTVGSERIFIVMTANGVSTIKLENMTNEEKNNFEELYEQDNPPMITDVLNQLRKGLKKE